MSSILTNNGAMIALQTLRGINDSMLTTQNEISTGKSVATAKDNAAVWAISKVMEADVKGFNAISDSLNLGKSTVAVARNASESITGLLTEIKGKIVNSQEANVDRAKIQQDIGKLRDQITAVVGAAQFNGLNLVNGESANPVQILSSLDRSSDGTVSASKIDVASVNLKVGTQVTGQTLAADSIAAGSSASGSFVAGSTTLTLDFGDAAGEAGGSTAVARPTTGTPTTAGLYAGDELTVNFMNQELKVTIAVGDTATLIAGKLDAAATTAGLTLGTATTHDVKFNGSGSVVTIVNPNDTAQDVSVMTTRDAGDLIDLANMDVTTNAGATEALSNIEGMLQKAIEASASFGSVEKRIEIQSKFISKLTDALKSGIGAMVDADMEETSARLQALQVQQQLSTQALSIANKAPQALLSLFR